MHPGFFAIAYTNGGPVSAVWGWILVATTNFFVALSMAEIVSAYPIAGGPYFWCAPASMLRCHAPACLGAMADSAMAGACNLGTAVPRRCLELLDNDPKYVLIGWLTGERLKTAACGNGPDSGSLPELAQQICASAQHLETPGTFLAALQRACPAGAME